MIYCNSKLQLQCFVRLVKKKLLARYTNYAYSVHCEREGGYTFSLFLLGKAVRIKKSLDISA